MKELKQLSGESLICKLRLLNIVEFFIAHFAKDVELLLKVVNVLMEFFFMGRLFSVLFFLFVLMPFEFELLIWMHIQRFLIVH